MALRHKDGSLRIRISSLTSKDSAACVRFIEAHDKLEGTKRVNRHIDIIRMGQMAHELGLLRALTFLDNAKWEASNQAQRMRDFLDIVRADGLIDLPAEVVPEKPLYQPAQPIQEKEQPEPQPTLSEPKETPPAVKPVAPVTKAGPAVKVTEDGSTFVTEEATSLNKESLGSLKNLLNGGA